jgi:hypothetical protein
MNEHRERREFLTRAGFTAAGLMLAGASSTRGYWANETIGIGCIGCGGRFRHLQRALRKIEGVQIVAVCDVYEENLQTARQLTDSKVAATKNYQEILGRKDVDAVLIATPDHWHVPITIAACEAGKDVYVEKPLTHDLKEGKAVIDAQNRHQRIVQVGMQQRSMPQFLEAHDIVQSGELGAIHKVHLNWNRNQPRGTTSVEVDPSQIDWKGFLGSAPDQPFDPFRFRQWRWFWDFRLCCNIRRKSSRSISKELSSMRAMPPAWSSWAQTRRCIWTAAATRSIPSRAGVNTGRRSWESAVGARIFTLARMGNCFI